MSPSFHQRSRRLHGQRVVFQMDQVIHSLLLVFVFLVCLLVFSFFFFFLPFGFIRYIVQVKQLKKGVEGQDHQINKLNKLKSGGTKQFGQRRADSRHREPEREGQSCTDVILSRAGAPQERSNKYIFERDKKK